MSVQIMGRGSSGYGGGEGLCLWLGGSSTSETDYNLIYLHDLLAARVMITMKILGGEDQDDER